MRRAQKAYEYRTNSTARLIGSSAWFGIMVAPQRMLSAKRGGTSGWNLAWSGGDRYKATRSIETHAETPEAARKLVARITELLNTHGE